MGEAEETKGKFVRAAAICQSQLSLYSVAETTAISFFPMSVG